MNSGRWRSEWGSGRVGTEMVRRGHRDVATAESGHARMRMAASDLRAMADGAGRRWHRWRQGRGAPTAVGRCVPSGCQAAGLDQPRPGQTRLDQGERGRKAAPSPLGAGGSTQQEAEPSSHLILRSTVSEAAASALPTSYDTRALTPSARQQWGQSGRVLGIGVGGRVPARRGYSPPAAAGQTPAAAYLQASSLR